MSDKTSSSEVKDIFADFGEKAVQSMQDHQYQGDGNKKLFGLFSMDSMVVEIVNKFWPIIAHRVNTVYVPKAYTLVQAQEGRLPFLKGSTLNRTAAGVALAANFTITALPRIGQFVSALGQQREQQRQAVRKIAPELDAIKGKHSLHAFHGVRKTDNEVIYAYRRRLNAEHHTSNLWNLISLGVITGPNLWSQRHFATGVSKGTPVAEEDLSKAQLAATDAKGPSFGEVFGHGGGNAIANVSIASVIDGIRDKKIKYIRDNRDQFCALEMIAELARQSDAMPEAQSFRMPGEHGREMTLEKYILNIAHQHQKDMAAIDPEHTVIRNALEDDLKAAVTPIAEAIRSGEISALSLIRLFGDGSVIKNKGRAVADPEAVTEALGKIAGKTRQQFDADLKEYFSDKTFTEKDAVKMLKSYEGEERTMLGAILPDKLAEQAGLSEKDREAIHSYRAQSVQEVRAALIEHLAAKSDEELRRENLGSGDIRHLREEAEKLHQGGDEAVKKLGGVGNGKVDAALLNWAMPQIMGDKTHFGAVVEAGRKELAERAQGGEGEERHAHEHHKKTHGEHHEGKGHAAREARRHEEAAEMDRDF